MYNNEYNNNIKERVTKNMKKQIAHQEKNNNMPEVSVTSKLEGMTARDENVHGGSGYAAGTLFDQGFLEESTKGIESIKPVARKRKPRIKKEIQGGAILGLSDIPPVDPRGDTPLEAPIVKTAPEATKYKVKEEPLKVGGAKKKVNKYALLVKEVMAKHNIKKLAEASKYIKDNNLYSKQ